MKCTFQAEGWGRDPPRLFPSHLCQGLLQCCLKMQATVAYGPSHGFGVGGESLETRAEVLSLALDSYPLESLSPTVKWELETLCQVLTQWRPMEGRYSVTSGSDSGHLTRWGTAPWSGTGGSAWGAVSEGSCAPLGTTGLFGACPSACPSTDQPKGATLHSFCATRPPAQPHGVERACHFLGRGGQVQTAVSSARRAPVGLGVRVHSRVHAGEGPRRAGGIPPRGPWSPGWPRHWGCPEISGGTWWAQILQCACEG